MNNIAPGDPLVACVGFYTYSCGESPNWIACTADWVYGQSVDGGVTWWAGPHIFEVEADFRTNPVDVNGNPYTWTTQSRNAAACHEIAGHGLGGTHVGSGPSGNPPETASCLTAVIYPDTPTTLGLDVRSDEASWANHDDSSYDGFWDTYLLTIKRTTTSVSPSRISHYRLRKLLAAEPWLYRQLGIDAKPILVTPDELAKKHGLPPYGYFYVLKGSEEPLKASSPEQE